MMETITICPFCGSKDLELEMYDTYSCNECGRLFDEEDVEREELRHSISPLLSGTSEENPLKCYIPLTDDPEVFGLSSLEVPTVVKAFLHEDGTIWFLIYGMNDYDNLDDFSIENLKTIYNGLRNGN